MDVPPTQVPPTATTDALNEELEGLQKDLNDFEDKYKFFSERFKAALDLVCPFFHYGGSTFQSITFRL